MQRGIATFTLVTLHCLCQFAGKKPFSQVTKADIVDFLDASKNRKFEDKRYRARANPKNVERQLANSTMNLIKLRVKRFFQWLYGMEKGEYPENVRWIELKTVRGDQELTPEDLPTAKEVKRMIECTENPRDRALISLMAESGARVGEISTIRLKDISWNDNGFIVTIRRNRSKSKFGRRIPLYACAEDIKRWVNDYYPFKNDPEAPLFTSFADRRTPKTYLRLRFPEWTSTRFAAAYRKLLALPVFPMPRYISTLPEAQHLESIAGTLT